MAIACTTLLKNRPSTQLLTYLFFMSRHQQQALYATMVQPRRGLSLLWACAFDRGPGLPTLMSLLATAGNAPNQNSSQISQSNHLSQSKLFALVFVSRKL